MIGIISYGLGNVRAFENMYRRMNVPVRIVSSQDDLNGLSHLILPGVGAFDHAMELFDESNLRGAVEQVVFGGTIRLLGVCVGMHMLGDYSEEGKKSGLGWISGGVRRLFGGDAYAWLPVPHLGWNGVSPVDSNGLLEGVEEGGEFYFLHSYYFDCASEENVVGWTDYGIKFPSAIGRGNIYGVQFHPEKSHRWGAALLRKFAGV